MKSMHDLGWAGAALALVALGAPLQARVVAVYTAPGQAPAFEAMKSAAAALAAGDEGEGSHAGFAYRVTDAAVLSPEFSVKPGVSAYFLSEESFAFDPAFETAGESMVFEQAGPAKAEPGKPEGAAPLGPSMLRLATLRSGSLTLAYSMLQPGPVSVRAYSLQGKTLGSWNWNEAGAGAFERTLELKTVPQGTFFVRWTSGDVQAIQKVSLQGVRE